MGKDICMEGGEAKGGTALGAGAAGVPSAAVRGGAVEDVLSALTNLGYQRVAAEKAVQHATEKEPGVGEDFDGLFRAALKVIR